MEGYDESSYGDGIADVYDDWYGGLTDVDAAVTRLAALASAAAQRRRASASGTAPSPPLVLELGVGTGRLAIPLAAAGFDVRGVDTSERMLRILRNRRDFQQLATDVAVELVDMSAATIPRRPTDPPGALSADLAFVAYNTLFNLPDRERQRRCLAAVADLLAPEGRFVVEAFVPDLDLGRGDAVTVRSMTAHRLVLTATVLDEAGQTISGHHIDLADGAPVRLRPFHLHYLRPDQLDELAANAGLQLEERTEDFGGAPFDPARSPHHVSVYRRA
jgi:SAM-dependent methyltransferase